MLTESGWPGSYTVKHSCGLRLCLPAEAQQARRQECTAILQASSVKSPSSDRTWYRQEVLGLGMQSTWRKRTRKSHECPVDGCRAGSSKVAARSAGFHADGKLMVHGATSLFYRLLSFVCKLAFAPVVILFHSWCCRKICTFTVTTDLA